MKIDYSHQDNIRNHTLDGPRTALPIIFNQIKPHSILDVGCGIGTWLAAALELGVSDVYGLDGIVIPHQQLLFNSSLFRQQDFTQPFELGRKFDALLCLEVAEHLDATYAATLIDSLTKHSDHIIFSAACPEQPGQHHVNCQWPSYWQKLFNECGYACVDNFRSRIWSEERIEPWYRQNMFLAQRNLKEAGREPRILSFIHPAIYRIMCDNYDVNRIEQGQLPMMWYLKCSFMALRKKIRRRLQ